jgi:peptidoglycan hydrolase-like protein with peptidoglycan-binding domain
VREARRGLAVAAALCVLVAAIAIAVTDPFTTDRGADGTLDNAAPTGLAAVERRSLTARQTLVGTVGYAGAWAVAIPATTSVADLQQAEQQVASAQAASTTSAASLDADLNALESAAAAAQAARLEEASDCAGANAAVSGPAPDGTSTDVPVSSSANGGCASSMAAAQTTQQVAVGARVKVVADRAQVASARTTLAGAQRSLAAAQSVAATYGGSASFTMLPAVGAVVTRGAVLYAIDGADTVLLYGSTPAWRSFAPGMTAGHDVAELNANLRALGYGAIAGDEFTSSTQRAIEALQQARGLPVTGSFMRGSVVFEPGAARVTGVAPAIGQSVQAGPIMTLSSTRHSVSVQLNAAEQSQVSVGDRVLITLPDNRTTPGVVDFVGRVATTVANDQGVGGGGGAPSLPMSVRFLRPGDAGTLDQAPVNVLVTTATVRSALVVPVNALVALAGGGYAIEVAATSGTRRLFAVTPGLFDDEEGLVQIKGAGVRPGQRVVVPSS